MARILAIANVKGGVGKTTTTANLAAALVERGRSVLAVDLDPQSSLTLCLGYQPDQLPRTICDALDGHAVPISSILLSTPDCFDLIPANYGLTTIVHELEKRPIQISALRVALDTLRDRYDYVLLDPPASTGILTGVALAAADEVVIPLTADYLTVQTLKVLLDIIQGVQKTVNANLRVTGIFYSMHDSKTRHAREVSATAESTYGAKIPFLSTTVTQSVVLKEASLAGKTIFRYAPNSPSTLCYRALAQEIDAGIQESSRNALYLALTKGHEMLARNDRRSGYAAFCHATTLDPNSEEAWAGRAAAATELEEVVRCNARLLQLNPARAEIRAGLEKSVEEIIAGAALAGVPELVGLAHSLNDLEQPHLAAQLYDRATELDPGHIQAWLGRARTSTDPREAIGHIQRGLEIDPQDSLAQSALAETKERLRLEAMRLVQEGLTLQRDGNRAQARQQFKRAVELDPMNDLAWLGCARTADSCDVAFILAKRALEINPNNQEAIELNRLLWHPPEDEIEPVPAPSRLILPLFVLALAMIALALALAWRFHLIGVP
ncbi:MAG: AAA family ATPase [Chloroflexi bacterium]|nr:AAA family ATPase [Chloroflexota bacterium]